MKKAAGEATGYVHPASTTFEEQMDSPGEHLRPEKQLGSPVTWLTPKIHSKFTSDPQAYPDTPWYGVTGLDNYSPSSPAIKSVLCNV
jgi:hypothetical protein